MWEEFSANKDIDDVQVHRDFLQAGMEALQDLEKKGRERELSKLKKKEPEKKKQLPNEELKEMQSLLP